MTVPALTAPRRPVRLREAEATLDNGLRVVAVRKPGLPLAEVRLRVPFLSAKAAHPAQAGLLGDTLLTGAAGLDRAALAAAVQALGGDLSVSTDADRLMIGGSVLAANLRKLLDLLASVLTEPSYPKDEVATERDRLVEKLTIARARPGVIASEALALRMWGAHPYALDLAQPADVAAVTRAQLSALHRSLVRPHGATLVLVGDVPPNRLVDHAAAALAGWTGRASASRVPALPAPPGGALLVVDRPGAVQSSLRMGGVAVSRTDPDYPALQLANIVFGGYFSSRWTKNLREDKGYTYGPHSRVDHHVLGSTIGLNVEVASEVTAPSVLETRYELGRIATLPVTEAEVASVRQYAIGTLALSTATQAGLASTLAALSAFGLGLDWIRDHPARLQATTVDEVGAAAARFLAPSAFTQVIVGDAESIAGPLATLGPVERA
ncbi:MAG TPA: pitrilysin family protein [Jatrophihabitans sp.]|nr:pitrilysin family protein [Jatrophihabitans sp.]